MLLDTYKGSEDCLFLNVYSRHLPTKESHPRLPVMVWLHGGGFTFGSGNAFLYGPDFLVAENIVLVTINYRLGPLGFLSVGGDASGNAGLKVHEALSGGNRNYMNNVPIRIKYSL